MTKLPPWLDAGEAIALIAFGKVPPRVVREDPEGPPESDLADLPELQETRDWRAPRDLLLAALEARAKGKQWRAPLGDYWTTDEVHAEIYRLESETGKDADALAEELRVDIARMGEAEARLRAAEAALRGAAKDGPVLAEGRPASRPNDPRDTIPTKWFDEKRRIGLDGTLKGPGGVEWVGVQFRAADVLTIRPEGHEPVTNAAPAAEAWMLAEAEQEYAAKGQRPKRDVIVQDCMRKTGCSWDEAVAAWGALPDHLRRRRGETNRAIARRGRAAAG